jgi:alpha-tubulin N-acetyltransferase 1
MLFYFMLSLVLSNAVNLMRSKEGEEMQLIINHMGELSGIAQRLRGPITSVERLLQSFQKIYMLTSSIQGRLGHILAHGILKVGQKRLFIRKDGVQLVEMSPLCVLDFYVHESCQRCALPRPGLGRLLSLCKQLQVKGVATASV